MSSKKETSSLRRLKSQIMSLSKSKIGKRTQEPRFYCLSPKIVTISGNPPQQHAFQPVHNATVVEVNKLVDGKTWKYFSYDSDYIGNEIRLFYSNTIADKWIPYSNNPILTSGKKNNFRWPSTAYVNGVFQMFLTNLDALTLERWTSTDGVHYSFEENVKKGGNQWKNPFVWLNPNDNQWYLYTHDGICGSTEEIKVRKAKTITGLAHASDTVVLSLNASFGSPTIMESNGMYWLLAEIRQPNKQWAVKAYCSSTSASSGFVEVENSPILTKDEACPMLFLDPSKTLAYLFVTVNKAKWWQETRQVYLDNF